MNIVGLETVKMLALLALARHPTARIIGITAVFD